MKKWMKWIGVVLAALIILPIVTLLILGQRQGAGKMEASEEISASPQQLWPWLEDGQKLKQWVSWTTEVQPWDPPQPGVGARRIWKMRDENNGGMTMDIQGICTEYKPPSRMTLQLAVKDEFDGQQTYRLTDLANGRTRLDIHSQFHFANRFAQLFEPLITPSAKRKLVGDMARLKTLVEQTGAGSRADLR